jgi:hypothetical protein
MAFIAMARSGAGSFPRRVPVLLALLACCGSAWANPFVPTDAKLVLETIPEARDPGGAQLRALHAALAADPGNPDLAVRAAQADIATARAAGDPRYLGRAEAALARWPAGPDTPVPVLLLRANLLQASHDFNGSLALLGQVVHRDPGNRQAWLTRAAVHLAHGDTDAARQDCGRFAVMSIGLVPDTCVAGVMAATGNAPAALRALTLSLATHAEEPAAARLFALTTAAETAAALGDASAADRFAAALAVDGNDPYLLAAYSDFLLDQHRPGDVVSLLAGRTRVDPLLLRLALAEQALGSARAAAHIADLANRFDTARSRGEVVHRREEARFRLLLCNDPAGALALARANWEVQREPADARILLEAASAAHAPEAARPVAAWIKQTGLQDVRLGVDRA